MPLECIQLRRAQRARRVGAHRFEDVLDRDVAILPASRLNRAAVEDEAGNIQAGQRHDSGGNRLVAADQHDERIEEIPPCDQFDRIGDHLTADERGAHALAAHGDAVRDRDGVELQGRAARVADAGLQRTPRGPGGGSYMDRSQSRCWRRR